MTNDVGIALLKPQYPQGYFNKADLAYWEVQYTDGTVLSEAAGGTYPQIDRGKFKDFRIVYAGENVIVAFPPAGATGYNFVYRRRTLLGQSGMGRAVLFIIGFAPYGPIGEFNLEANTWREDTVGLLATLTPMPGEPDNLLMQK